MVGHIDRDRRPGGPDEERDVLTSDDPLGSYVREFGCRAEDWLGRHHDASPAWELWYRIEKG